MRAVSTSFLLKRAKDQGVVRQGFNNFMVFKIDNICYSIQEMRLELDCVLKITT